MARTRSISSIEAEIAKLEAELNKAQEKVDAISAKLLKLQKQKQEHEAKQLMEAYKKAVDLKFRFFSFGDAMLII